MNPSEYSRRWMAQNSAAEAFGQIGADAADFPAGNFDSFVIALRLYCQQLHLRDPARLQQLEQHVRARIEKKLPPTPPPQTMEETGLRADIQRLEAALCELESAKTTEAALQKQLLNEERRLQHLQSLVGGLASS